MSLGLLIGYYGGSHAAAWLHPDNELAQATDIEYYKRLIKIAEDGKFDLFFIADGLGVRMDKLNVHARTPSFINQLEPLTLAANLAGFTDHIGVGATVSTTYSEPYNVARSFASLDHISGGRAAMNIVTSSSDESARCFGHEKLPSHTERYGRAKEFVSVLKKLWDSWGDDAFILDRSSGRAFDPSKQYAVHHHGRHFSLDGVLNIARPPQGRPVIIQAGASDVGKDLAAESAEIVFVTGSTFEQASAFYKDLKERMAKYGRHPDTMKILLGFPVIVADTDEEADTHYAELQALVHPDVAVLRLGVDLETDLSNLPLDQPIPLDRIPATSNLNSTYFNRIRNTIVSENPTLGELAMRYQRGIQAHRGSSKKIADMMQSWFERGACDGFMLSFATLSDGLVKFVGDVVPDLQQRGVFRLNYSGKTLRDHLGLERPAHRHSDA